MGCETALWLARQGKDVTIVEARSELLSVNAPLCSANTDMLLALIDRHHVRVVTGGRLLRAGNGDAVVSTAAGEVVLPADTVVIAVGYEPERTLYRQAEGRVSELYLLGDARRVANIMYAVWDAYEVARYI